MTTTEGNRLIAEFMGAKYPHDFQKSYAVFRPVIFGDMQGDYSCDDKDLRFHSSWDWLMPVVKKIFKINMIPLDKSHPKFLLQHSILTLNDINDVYTEVVNFIQWYNQNKQP